MSDYRAIPSIDELRRRPALQALESRYGAAATVDAIRAAAAEVRKTIGAGAGVARADDVVPRIESAAAAALERAFRPSLDAVINATGVVIHTNLGRAPLAASAIERIAAVSRGYCSLEYDVSRGERGQRDVHAERLLCRLTGAEAAVVVNNNAAAALLLLAAVAVGREVIVSRGELVEIGGGFRVPDVLKQSGAVLREVGTTNRTRISDYAAAVTDRTALILRIHPSNFRIEGFTARPSLNELVDVGRKLGVPVAEDLGSGLLDTGFDGQNGHPLANVEPSVNASIAAGVDACCFSGDKLVGGPQAGIVVGRKTFIAALKKHPLMRALRVDKLTYAALEATLVEYAAGRAANTIPVQRMLTMTADAIRARAEHVAAAIAALAGWRATLVEDASAAGGGSAPGVALPTWLVAVESDRLTASQIDERLRALEPPIVARILRDRVVLDVRTIPPADDEVVIASFARL
ncbi:MAG TPA: L-seryl-tRNA(Sec) selenium transferase [Vicinamibacterales bacterium]|jgi:L-seryl-tRNA(Ser) seleniumtransferase